MGLLVKRVIQALEASISATMQPGFPNVLDADGVPLSEWRRLEGELTKLEWEIGRMTTSFTENGIGADENWEPAKAAAASYLAKEMLFLDQASMFHNRYVEMREPLRLALIRSRHAYLKDIIEMMNGVWEIKESPEVTSTEENNEPQF